MKLGRLGKLVLWGWFGLFFCVALAGLWVGYRWSIRALSELKAVHSEQLSNRIVFVGNDGNLWLVAPDGRHLTHLTTDGGHQFPTWSPNGKWLAFIGPDEAGRPALYVSDLAAGRSRLVFTSADSTPFYIYWSPDSLALTFLTQESSTLAMRVADVQNPDYVRVMAQGDPFYWAWSPSGDQLLMHVGGSWSVSPDAHLSLLENREGAQRVELEPAPGQFQAPLWSADGQTIYYIAAAENGAEAIYQTDVATSKQSFLVPLDGPALMVLSPTGQHVAYLQVRHPRHTPAYGAAFVVNTAGGAPQRVLDDQVAAMYWSPDGKKLALLTLVSSDEGPTARAPGLAAPLTRHLRYRWWVYEVETEQVRLLTSFVPTPDFEQTVPFFDQYHLSLTFWSPDSRYLLVARRDGDGDAGAIWVFDTTGQETPRQIGPGSFAVWSWQ